METLTNDFSNRDQEGIDRILIFIDERTTADEVPNGIVRFLLALAGSDPTILTDGTCLEVLKKLEAEGAETFEGWCTKEEFDATMKLIREKLLGLN